MRLLNFVAGIAALIGATCSAQASVYNFTIDSIDYDVVGQITTSGDQITSISGQVTGLSWDAAITGLGNQPNDLYTSDNLFNLSGGPYVSNAGVLFSAGGFFFNVYSVANGPTNEYYISTNQFGADFFKDPLFNPGSLILSGTIAAVPEPSTWVMMLLGFGGIYMGRSGRVAETVVTLVRGERVKA